MSDDAQACTGCWRHPYGDPPRPGAPSSNDTCTLAPAPPGGDDAPGMTTPCPKCGGARSVNDKGEWSCYGECGGYGTLPGGDGGAAAGRRWYAENGWVCEEFKGCTCGGSGILSPAHQPGCGLVPLALLGVNAAPLVAEHNAALAARDAALAEAARARAEVERLTRVAEGLRGDKQSALDRMVKRRDERDAARADRARLAATLGRVEGLLDDPDDPYAHTDDCIAARLGHGDPDCGACWTADLRAALSDAGTDGGRQTADQKTALGLLASWAEVEEQRQRLDKVTSALADCVVKATEYGEQDGGFVAFYLMPTGPLHRAIPLLQEVGITVRPGFDGRPAAGTDETGGNR